MLSLAAEGRDQLSVVTDQRGCPTWTGHLAPALLRVAAEGLGGVVHVAGGGEATWNELAREVFEQAGLAVQVLPATSAEQRRPAPRPAYSVLDSEREDAPRLAPWTEGVRGHLAARAPLAATGSGAQ
jgi:dTDP-4-dehydrorhamnose reductase